jgi:hypothetical protein
MDNVKCVEPILIDETKEYINNLVDYRSVEIIDSVREKYLKHVMKDGDEETFASFVTLVDTLDRNCDLFRRVGYLHLDAIQSNEVYKKLYEESFKFDSKLKKLIDERSEWTKNDRGKFNKL